jgi:hypothetical protein
MRRCCPDEDEDEAEDEEDDKASMRATAKCQ